MPVLVHNCIAVSEFQCASYVWWVDGGTQGRNIYLRLR
uniref:Uncharacterized protein n=1 Tax=Anguilla anguilla TaxID=7936 RepID=A0A0E9SYJ6_ANGAN